MLFQFFFKIIIWSVFIFYYANHKIVVGAPVDTSSHILLYNATDKSIYIGYLNNFNTVVETYLLPKKENKISANSPILIKIYNRQKRPLIFYLKPGEQLRVLKNMQNEWVIKGKDYIRNNELELLKQLRLTFGITTVWGEMSFEENKKIWALIKQPNLYEAFINDTYKKQQHYIDSFANMHTINNEFRLYSHRHIFYELMYNKIELASIRKNLKDSLAIFSRSLNCDSCLADHAYLNFLGSFSSAIMQAYKDSTLTEINRYGSPKTRDFMLMQCMIFFNSSHSGLFKQQYKNFINLAKDSTYKAYVENLQQANELKNVLNGTDLLLSPNGDTIRLQILLNKVKDKNIYIDCWASWCSPCIEGIPNTKAFEDNNKQMAVVYLSFDKNPNSWKTYSKSLGLNERNSYLMVGNFESPMAKRLQIKEIPRYVLISKNRKTTISNAPDAKDKKLVDLIQSLK